MNGAGYIETLMLNLIGAVVGAFMALLLRSPRGWHDFRRRAMFSVLAGVFLAPVGMAVVQKVLHLNSGPESVVAGATLTSIGAWFVAKSALRRVDKFWPGK